MVSHIEELGGSGLAQRLTGRLRHWFGQVAGGCQGAGAVGGFPATSPGGRILTTTRDNRGRWVAASDRALYYCRCELKCMPVSEEWIRLGLEQVAGVLWDRDLERLTLFGLLRTVPRRTVLDLPIGHQ